MGIELILAWLGAILGVPGFIIAFPWMRKVIGRFVTTKVVFVFGPSGVGKTSFLRFLEEEPVPPNHVATVGREETTRIAFPIGQQDRTLVARSFIEFGAEHDTMFKTEFRARNPIALVLIIDHAQQEAALQYASYVIGAVRGLSEVLIEKKIQIKCILVLVNKADLWANSPSEIQKCLREYEVNPVGKKMMEILKYKPRCKVIFKASCLIDPQLRQYTVEALAHLVKALRG